MEQVVLAFSLLSEDISDLIYQALIFEVFGFDFGELFEDVSLLAREGRRRDDRDGDEEVSASASAEHGHSLSLQTKDCSGLRSGGNLDLLLIAERLHSDLRAERSLREVDR